MVARARAFPRASQREAHTGCPKDREIGRENRGETSVVALPSTTTTTTTYHDDGNGHDHDDNGDEDDDGDDDDGGGYDDDDDDDEDERGVSRATHTRGGGVCGRYGRTKGLFAPLGGLERLCHPTKPCYFA